MSPAASSTKTLPHPTHGSVSYEASKKTTPHFPQQDFRISQPVAPGTYLGPIDASKPGSDKAPLLFEPIQIKNLQLANRIVVAPMCMYSSQDGFMTDFHLVHLGSYAMHGAGLVIAEATAVEPRGRISPSDTGIWSDDHIPAIKRVVDYVHAAGGKIGIQLAHAGRKASTVPPYNTVDPEAFWKHDVVAPTGDLRWDDHHVNPRELSVEEIQEVVAAFGAAARRADMAGMDTVEIHGAHGYLINNFLSAVTNQRTDQYGGSFENRARFLMEIIRAVRANFSNEKPIFLRVSATDWLEWKEDTPSWDIEQTVELAKLVKEAGVDVFHVSSGGNHVLQKIKPVPGYQVPFAERVKHEVPGLVVVAVGAITSGQQANDILVHEKADLIAVARGYLRDPGFALTAARELNVKAKFSQQYERGRIQGHVLQPSGLLPPAAGRSSLRSSLKAPASSSSQGHASGQVRWPMNLDQLAAISLDDDSDLDHEGMF
ncbi:protein disulfide-isomerase precursor [Actinomortierella ambigua]|uniref:Protein disulfide-isomerase n=1 Tax=Actinomortierella ambigua TaxID=1343610 RepID=A0A9P6QLP0_9FUNG|nr:protein disulfide-isomerase precursor [Actinomortierella ambigua]